MNRRVDLGKIMRDPVQRRDLIVETVMATQAREERDVPREQVEQTYDEMLSRRQAEAKQHQVRQRMRERGVR